MIVVYIANPTHEHAVRLARTLVEEHLLACANIVASESVYTWEGNIRSEREAILIGKTTEQKVERLRKRAAELHEHDVPCILSLPAEANAPYAQWVRDTLS